MNKYFRRILFSDCLSSIATQAYNLFLIWYFASQLHNQSLIALLSSIQLADLFFGPLGGAVADISNPLKVIKQTTFYRIIISLLLLAITCFMQVRALAFFLLLFALITSIISAFYAACIEVTTYKLSQSETELIKNNTGFTALTQLASIFSAALMAVMSAFLSLKESILIITLLLVISGLSILSKKLPINLIEHQAKKINFSELFTQTFQGIGQLKKLKVITVIIPYALALNFLYWLFWYLQPAFLNNSLSLFKSAFSIQELVIATVSVITTLFIQKKPQLIAHTVKHYRFLLLFQNGSLFLLSLSFAFLNRQNLILICVLLFWTIYSIFNTLTGIIFLTMIQNKVDEQILGTILSTSFTLLSSMTPLAGICSDFIWLRAVNLVVITGLMVLIILLSFFDHRFTAILNSL